MTTSETSVAINDSLRLEPFCTNSHIMKVATMGICKESAIELEEAYGDLMSPNTGVLTSLQSSKHAYVVLDLNGNMVAALGVAVTPLGLAVPWFLSSGFERDRRYTKDFLRGSKDMVNGWFTQLPYRIYQNKCLNSPRIVRWLRWLGFQVTESTKDFTCFMWVRGDKRLCVHP